MFGISVGGIIVIVGIVLMIIWSLWIGLIVALVGSYCSPSAASPGAEVVLTSAPDVSG